MTTAQPAWRKYLLDPILGQLRQGISPDKIALTLAVGIALGIFPVIGSTTLLCAAAGLALRLNQPILQLVNYVVYPAQIALIVVFVRLGEHLYGAAPIPFSVTQLLERFRAAPLLFLKEFSATFLHCISAWLLLAPLLVAALYFVSRPLLRAAAKRL